MGKLIKMLVLLAIVGGIAFAAVKWMGSAKSSNTAAAQPSKSNEKTVPLEPQEKLGFAPANPTGN